jgi:hypothetical protein
MKNAIDLAKGLQTKAAGRRAPAQLEFWSERVRGLPNALARCALFTAGSKRDVRAVFHDEPIVSLQNFTVLYSGDELRQDDQDVFLQLVHLARGLPLGSKIEITGNAVLKVLAWGRSKRDYARLRGSLKRLKKANVEVNGSDNRGFIGSLLMTLAWEGQDADADGEGTSTHWTISLDPKIIALFGSDTYTLIDWETRLKLTPLAKWLHSFYITHREPMPYKVETLHKLCGSRTKLLKHFKAALKDALDELKQVGFIQEFDIGTDLVTVRRRYAIAA